MAYRSWSRFLGRFRNFQLDIPFSSTYLFDWILNPGGAKNERLRCQVTDTTPTQLPFELLTEIYGNR
jgi:hypothetical protein